MSHSPQPVPDQISARKAHDRELASVCRAQNASLWIVWVIVAIGLLITVVAPFIAS